MQYSAKDTVTRKDKTMDKTTFRALIIDSGNSKYQSGSTVDIIQYPSTDIEVVCECVRGSNYAIQQHGILLTYDAGGVMLFDTRDEAQGYIDSCDEGGEVVRV